MGALFPNTIGLSYTTESAKGVMDMEEQTKEKPKINKKRMVVILVFFFIVAIMMAIALPGYVPYRPERYCYRAMDDAHNIKGAIADYYGDPAHTSLNITPDDLADSAYIQNINNPWHLSVSADNIFIHVVDGNGKCPAEYQARHPEWHAGTYTLKVLD
jgi:hypothetical protein